MKTNNGFAEEQGIEFMYRTKTRFITPLWGYFPFRDTSDLRLDYEKGMPVKQNRLRIKREILFLRRRLLYLMAHP